GDGSRLPSPSRCSPSFRERSDAVCSSHLGRVGRAAGARRDNAGRFLRPVRGGGALPTVSHSTPPPARDAPRHGARPDPRRVPPARGDDVSSLTPPLDLGCHGPAGPSSPMGPGGPPYGPGSAPTSGGSPWKPWISPGGS